jgi:SSS family transporter
MHTLDWLVIAIYLGGLLLMALWLGRGQQSRADYFLGGRSLPGWTLAVSIIATQCSTNSLLGAPAFVGFAEGGGLVWLQYEMAVPLAMLALAVLFVPVHASGVISVYAFLEQRLGRPSRLVASACFLVFRAIATGVVVYGVASVLALITGASYLTAVLLLMGVTIVYDVLGGIRAVVLSDVVQMVLLLAAVIAALLGLGDDLVRDWESLRERASPLVNDWGIRSGEQYGAWPMLFGGLFLYVAYYGCDQSQAQRLLAAQDRATLYRVLLLNGLLRFPLVALYCLLGLGLAAYATEHPGFLASLPKTAAGEPNLNLVFPAYVLESFIPGFAGLAVVGLFAAAMSSIDSALNSLSASTLEDFLIGSRQVAERRLFRLSKGVTLIWGLFAVGFSFFVERIAPTVLEAINKVGSMANGPLLALFLIALFLPRIGSRGAVTAFVAGLLGNGMLLLLAPGVSWLWWNVAGAVIAMAVAVMWGLGARLQVSSAVVALPPARLAFQLGGMALFILLGLAALQFTSG